ncbi:hypothetical protein ABZT26_37535 [Streptomyces sp. NPDC005395]|uniref:hypothetical protein n=1 Tax=Streptomyces sp. NPDC005395 TaxID=3157042 RepID=UPI0033B6C2EB
MGRDAKRKKQARRDQRERSKQRVVYPRLPEGERYSSVGQAIADGTIGNRTDAERTTVGFLANAYVGLQENNPAGPACGGPLLIHGDGGFQCTAGCPGGTKVLHVPEALHFCDYADQLGITADELGHVCPACTAPGATAHPRAFEVCTGTEIDHQDGTTTCSLGSDCLGAEELHASGQTCGMLAPCARCGITEPLVGGRAH